MLVQKQILVLLKAEQGDGLKLAGLRILAEENRVLALHVAVFGGEGEHAADVVAEFGAMPRDHPQILVGDVIEHLVPHLPLNRRPAIAANRSRAAAIAAARCSFDAGTLAQFALELVAGAEGVTRALILHVPRLHCSERPCQRTSSSVRLMPSSDSDRFSLTS